MVINSTSLEDNILGTLSRELNHDYVRVRRAAVERAEHMLETGQFPEQVIALLKTASYSDTNTSIRDQAQQVLEKFESHYAFTDATFKGLTTIDIHCSSGHANHFDKKEICANLGDYWRRSVLRDDLLFQEIVLTCQICGEEIITDVDCEGNY